MVRHILYSMLKCDCMNKQLHIGRLRVKIVNNGNFELQYSGDANYELNTCN